MNSQGNYTYYADYASALQSAKAGDTIVQFANIVEFKNAPITLKNGVNINLNGFTFDFRFSTLGGMLYSNGAVVLPSGGGAITCSIMNGKIIAPVVANIYALCLDAQSRNPDGAVTLTTNCVFVGNSFLNCWNVSMTINGGVYLGVFSLSFTTNTYITTLNNCVANSYNSTPYTGGVVRLNNCIATTNGLTSSLNYGGVIYLNNSIFISSSGIGLQQSGGYNNIYVNNCTAISTVGVAGNFGSSSVTNVVNSNFISTAGNALNATPGGVGVFYNCFAHSSTGNSTSSTNASFYNCNLVSAAAISAIGLNYYINSTIDCQWNNPLGHAVQNAISIIKCYLKVANVRAKCINATTPKNTTFVKNTYQGATEPVAGNVVQSQQNTRDLYGNITIG